MEKCSYCRGIGFIGSGFIEKEVSGHRVIYPHTEPCYCRINASIGKKYGILSPVAQPTPEDSEIVHKEYGGRDILFYGSEDLYLYIVKCFFLKGFMYKNYIILEGGTIVEQYNVPKDSKGEWLTTSHLNQYDLLALMFTTSARYTSLKDCVLEVIKNRSRLAKPTWVFSPSEDEKKKSHEYSEDLEKYFNSYRTIHLKDEPKLKGFVSRKSKLKKTELELNDRIAKF